MTDSLATSPTLDLARLRAQTGGDADLERQVLGLFVAKSSRDLDLIRAAGTAAARRNAAHGLLGSARAVGALDVARLAEAIQASGEGSPEALADLSRAISLAHSFIRGQTQT